MGWINNTKKAKPEINEKYKENIKIKGIIQLMY